MRRRLRILLTTTLTLVATLVSTAGAQYVQRISFEVPFDFIVQGKKLNAGRYTIQRVNSHNPAILVIKTASGATKRVILTRRLESAEPAKRPKLVFTRNANAYHLVEVWPSADFNGRQLPLIDSKHDKRGPASELTVFADWNK